MSCTCSGKGECIYSHVTCICYLTVQCEWYVRCSLCIVGRVVNEYDVWKKVYFYVEEIADVLACVFMRLCKCIELYVFTLWNAGKTFLFDVMMNSQ